MHTIREKGFTHASLIILVIVVLAIGAVGWRVATMQQQKNNSKSQTQQESKDKPIDRLSPEDQEKLEAKNGHIPPTAEKTPAVATTRTTAPKPVNNSTKGTTKQKVKTPAPATAPAPSNPTVLRPTAEFCAQKNGASFTNVWFTGTGTYTYDGYAWENGYSYSLPRVSKTETGTPLRNYDTKQIFDVVEYGTQPKWAICSNKAGYVMVYYSVPNSPYTFNVLAEYGHLSLQKP